MMHDAAAHERIQVRAYYLWNERGRPIGTPEVDWFRAEQGLVGDESALLVAAKTIGTAMGTVAGAVDSVSRGRHMKTKRSRG